MPVKDGATDTAHCVGCGAELPGEDAICPRCAIEYADPADTGKYVCLRCRGRFDKPAQGLWPPAAPWYRPQDLKPQCPRCGQFLSDRKMVALSSAEALAFVILSIVVGFLPWRVAVTPVLLAALSLLLLLRWRRARASVEREEARYAEASPLTRSPACNSGNEVHDKHD